MEDKCTIFQDDIEDDCRPIRDITYQMNGNGGHIDIKDAYYHLIITQIVSLAIICIILTVLIVKSDHLIDLVKSERQSLSARIDRIEKILNQ